MTRAKPTYRVLDATPAAEQLKLFLKMIGWRHANVSFRERNRIEQD